MLSMCHVRTIHWGMGNLTLATALKKKRFSVPQQPSNPPIALQLGLGLLLPLHSFLFRTWSPPKIKAAEALPRAGFLVFAKRQPYPFTRLLY